MQYPPDLVLAKTALGAAEIATRQHGLPARLRQVLILVDGRRSIAELGRLLPAQELPTHLATLEERGFVARPIAAVLPEPGPATGPAPGAPGRAPTGAPLADLDAQRRRVVRLLLDAVGPSGDAMAVRIERCRSADELRELLPAAASVVEAVRGRAAMREFLERAGAT